MLHVRDPAVVQRGEEVAHVEDRRRCRRATRGRRGSACTASRSPPRGLLGRQVDRERDHLRPRDHHLVRPPCPRSRRPCRASPAPPPRSRPVLGLETSVRMSASRVHRARSAPGGSTPSSRDTASLDFCEQPDERREDRAKQVERRREHDRERLGSAASASPFGTSSPSTTWKIGQEQEREREREQVAERRVEVAARARLADGADASEETVTPSCIAAMNRGGSAVIRAQRSRAGCPLWSSRCACAAR